MKQASNQFFLKIALTSAMTLMSVTTYARNEIDVKPGGMLNLSKIHSKEVIVQIPYPGASYGSCGIVITAWDAAPEFAELANSLEITNDIYKNPMKIQVSTQEPQGELAIDLHESFQTYLVLVRIKTKTGESLAKLSKRIFRGRALALYSIKCEPQENL